MRLLSSRTIATMSYIANISVFATLANKEATTVALCVISAVMFYVMYLLYRKRARQKQKKALKIHRLKIRYVKKYKLWRELCDQFNYETSSVDEGTAFIATNSARMPVGYFANQDVDSCWILVRKDEYPIQLKKLYLK